MTTEFEKLQARRGKAQPNGRALIVYDEKRELTTIVTGVKKPSLALIALLALLIAFGGIAFSLNDNRVVSATVTFEDGETPTPYALASLEDMFHVFETSYAATEFTFAKQIRSIAPNTNSWSRSDLVALARDAAKQEGIDADLFHALIKAESNYETGAISPKCAMSLAQLMPSTAADLGLAPADYFDPQANLRGGARYLRSLLDEFDDIGFALAAYNAGPSRVKNRDPSHWPPETQDYVAKVLRLSGAPSSVTKGQSAESVRAAALTGSIASMTPASAKPVTTANPVSSAEIKATPSKVVQKTEIDTSAADAAASLRDNDLEEEVKAFLTEKPGIDVSATADIKETPATSLKAAYSRQVKGADL